MKIRFTFESRENIIKAVISFECLPEETQQPLLHAAVERTRVLIVLQTIQVRNKMAQQI